MGLFFLKIFGSTLKITTCGVKEEDKLTSLDILLVENPKMWDIEKICYDNSLIFKLYEDSELIKIFKIEDIKVDDKKKYDYHFDNDFENILFHTIEKEGMIIEYTIESDVTPSIKDFKVFYDIVETMDDEYIVIDKILYKYFNLEPKFIFENTKIKREELKLIELKNNLN